jgi:hypothetical protein
MSATIDAGFIDATRLAALAERLGVSPRVLVAAAARVAQLPEVPLDEGRLVAEITRARDAGVATDAAVELLMLGHGAYAKGDLADALAMVWSDHFSSIGG